MSYKKLNLFIQAIEYFSRGLKPTALCEKLTKLKSRGLKPTANNITNIKVAKAPLTIDKKH